MTNSEPRAEAERIVEQLTTLLSEEDIARKIERPIEQAVEEFELQPHREVSHDLFHRTIARFVRHIHRHGLRCRRRLTRRQAHDRAISILSRSYQGDSYHGYEAALLDATSPGHGGLRAVLRRLAENIKEKERAGYISWVFRSRMDPRRRPLREEVAGLLLERNAPFLSDEAKAMTPGELADCWQELALYEVKTDGLLRQMCAHSTGSP